MSTPRIALPGLITGTLGLVAGGISFVSNWPIFAVVAGVLALAAGVSCVQIAQQLVRQKAVQLVIEDELKSVRNAAKNTEEKVNAELRKISQASGIGEDDEQLTDPETGLFSESFFRASLDSRVAAARRHLRPVAVALIDVVCGLPDGPASQATPTKVAPSITETLRGADTACRLKNGYFAALLEDTPENGAIWTVERIRRKLSETNPEVTVWAGVACYPAHAFGAEEILQAAEEALENAREWRQDRIEVAAAATD